MEENIKSLIKTMLIYGIGAGDKSVEMIIRKFNFHKGKDWADLINVTIPPQNRDNSYDQIKEENFNEIQLIAFTKMSMWQVCEKEESLNNIEDEVYFEKIVNDILKTDINNVADFIKENEELLEEKNAFYLAIFYKYLISKEENFNNIEYYKKLINLYERSNFNSLWNNDDIVEKFKLYDEYINNNINKK
ncbi:MAG: hypothetical protein E7313_01995 [Clostridiales bacterium]|nr:hypothetical protein [Clostridiales bacterium]